MRLFRATLSTCAPLMVEPPSIPRMLQTLRAGLGQGRGLNSILHHHAINWVPVTAAADDVRPLGLLLTQLLSLDHMDEAWGVWHWMTNAPEAHQRPTRPEYLVMLHGLNLKGQPNAARQALELYTEVEQQWAADPTPSLAHTRLQARREGVCALGTLGRFREAVGILEMIQADRAAAGEPAERPAPKLITRREALALQHPSKRAWPHEAEKPSGWPRLDDEIVHYRSMAALLEEPVPSAAESEPAARRGGGGRLSQLRGDGDLEEGGWRERGGEGVYGGEEDGAAEDSRLSQLRGDGDLEEGGWRERDGEGVYGGEEDGAAEDNVWR